MTNPIEKILELGGPILLILVFISIITLSVFLSKIWQFHTSNVGRQKAIKNAIQIYKAGKIANAHEILQSSNHFMSDVYTMAMDLPQDEYRRERLEAEAELTLRPLESSFRFLDTVAQLAPLLGLLGTVLGMVKAFKALQSAGSQVDPSLLAGGIWVALLTTAAGLIVAMPTTIGLTWLEAKMDKERALADYAISILAYSKSNKPVG